MDGLLLVVMSCLLFVAFVVASWVARRVLSLFVVPCSCLFVVRRLLYDICCLLSAA